MSDSAKPRLLVFIVAYYAEKTIEEVLSRIPASLAEIYSVHVLVIDDSSSDATFARGHLIGQSGTLPFDVTVLANPVNQGYGGNQKIGYRYAIEKGYDFVALVHGDAQYAPECLPELLEPLRRGAAEAVFGSRMLEPSGARRGGMPVYKLAGNRILTAIQNKLLRSRLSEFHSGYRIYSAKALEAVPFELNANGFHFDTEIIIQFLIAGHRIQELPIPTHYGDEICRVNGIHYAVNVVCAAMKARLQDVGLFYDPKFDCASPNSSPYQPKLNYRSPHSLAFDRIPQGSSVLDIGCAGGYVGTHLTDEKQCRVDGIDAVPVLESSLRKFYLADLNREIPVIDYSQYDYVVMLDVIEHLMRPEQFLYQLREALSASPRVEVIISTANIAFFVTRFMLVAGQFNYGRRGILDMTHTRLFTFSSFERAVKQAGFDVIERLGVPGPFPLALGDTRLSRILVSINSFLIRLSPGLFSYQIFLRIRPKPGLKWLLRTAEEHSRRRAEELNNSR